MFNRTFARCMGLCATSDTLWMSSLYQLWRFDNRLEPQQRYQGFDRLYVLKLAYTTMVLGFRTDEIRRMIRSAPEP